MSAWNDIHIKQRVEIAIKSIKKTHNFGSIIIRKNDNSIFFRMPTSQQAPNVIKKGVPCELTIHTDRSQVSFIGEVVAIHPGNPPSVQINRPSEDQLTVRTKGSEYGLMDEIPLTYRVMRDPVTPISDMKKAKTVSIGPGDCVIATIQALKQDNYVEINYSLPPDDTSVTLVGKVVDCNEIKTGAQVSYECQIKYDIIRPSEQDKIVKYIFDKQRSLRKRGMY